MDEFIPAFLAASHFSPAGNPAPPRPLSSAFLISLIMLSESGFDITF